MKAMCWAARTRRERLQQILEANSWKWMRSPAAVTLSRADATLRWPVEKPDLS